MKSYLYVAPESSRIVTSLQSMIRVALRLMILEKKENRFRGYNRREDISSLLLYPPSITLRISQKLNKQ